MAKTYRRKVTPSWITDEKDEEFIAKYWGNKKKLIARYHSDAWNSSHRKKWIKRTWAKWRRQRDRQEFVKFLKQEYEPIWFTTKIDTWWWN